MKTSDSKKIQQSGFSLIEVLVSVGLLSLVSLGMMTMISNQNKSITVLGEKLTAKDLEISLKSLMLNRSFCSCLVNGKTFNTGTNQVSAISSVPTGYTNLATCTAAATNLIPTAGSVFNNSTSLRVGSINVENVVVQSASTYTAELTVGIDPASGIMPLKGFSTVFNFNIDTSSGTPAARPILSCSPDIAVTKNFVYFNGGTVGPGWVLHVPGLACATNNIVVEYGGKLEHTGDENSGTIRLSINGGEVSRRRIGGWVSGADVHANSNTGYGLWQGACVGSITLTTDFFRDFQSPNFSGGFIKVTFL